MMMMTTVEWPHFLPTNRGLMIWKCFENMFRKYQPCASSRLSCFHPRCRRRRRDQLMSPRNAIMNRWSQMLSSGSPKYCMMKQLGGPRITLSSSITIQKAALAAWSICTTPCSCCQKFQAPSIQHSWDFPELGIWCDDEANGNIQLVHCHRQIWAILLPIRGYQGLCGKDAKKCRTQSWMLCIKQGQNGDAAE